MDSASKVILWLNVLFAAFVIGTGLLLILRFREPFESVVVALLMLAVSHATANSFRIDEANEELAQRLGVPREMKANHPVILSANDPAAQRLGVHREMKADRRAQDLHRAVNIGTVLVVDLFAVVSIIATLVRPWV